MELSSGVKKFLSKLGVNTTRLQWRLYEREKERDAARKAEADGRPMPSKPGWMKYKHKFCSKCNGLVDRDEKVCPHCGARLPSVGVYKVLRGIGMIKPEGAPIAMMSFLTVMMALFLVAVLTEDSESIFQAIMNPSRRTLNRFGSMGLMDFELKNYWRLLSFGLFHFGLIHIGFNTMALMQVGPMLEKELGSRRMLVLITFSQITSALAVEFWDKYGAVGASGWLFGLIGFGVTYYHRHGGSQIALRNHFFQWAVYGFLFGWFLGFNNAAHFGGLIGGAALGLTADLTLARKTLWTRIWAHLTWPCLALWAVTGYYLVQSIMRG